MSLNRSLLTQLTKDLNKKPSKPKVPKNQWQHPGEITTINSPNITMDAVDYPVLGVPNVGNPQMMYPNQQYSFTGASNVTEYPIMGKGGLLSKSVTCSSCGHSWKATDGGSDPLSCHKCGGTIKMKGGGEHGGLDRWFAEDWVDVKTGKECGRQEGESRKGYPACRPSKRVNSDTPKTASELSSAEREKFKREKTSSQRISYNHKKQMGGFITDYDMHDSLDVMKSGGNVPTNPSLWSRAKAAAKAKYDVYPSAYANGFAAKWYKSKGGGWRKAEYGMEVMGEGGIPNNPGFNALPDYVQQQIFANMAQGGTNNPGFEALPEYVKAKILSNMAVGGYIPEMGGGGYVVTRSNDRKGKTHKVTGPDGTVKYFGDSKLGQHPKDPERKKAFYARHKKNLEGNPFFRAFARKTWAEGGQTSDERDMVNGIADILSQVNNADNRAAIAQNMINDFKNQNVTYDLASFMQKANLKQGGGVMKYQTAGQVIKPNNGYIDLQKYGIDPITEDGLAKARELNAMYPGSKFVCTANGCADIAQRIAKAEGVDFPRRNAWEYRGNIPEVYTAPGYKAELEAGKPLHDPRSYAFPEEVKNMSGVLVGLNRKDNYDGHMAKTRKEANDSRDYINRMLYPGSNAMHEHIGFYKDGIMYHGTAGNKSHPAYFVLDNPDDGISLPGVAKYNVVNAMEEPGLLDNIANGFTSLKTGISNLMSDKKQKGGSIYDFMTSHGMNGSFANRKKLFNQYFGKGYTGTADQNMQMLQLMQQGKFKAPAQPMMATPYAPKPTFSGATTGLSFLQQTRAPYKPGKAPQYKAQPKQNPVFEDVESSIPDMLRKGADAIGLPLPVTQAAMWLGSKLTGSNIGMSNNSLSPEQQEILYQTIKNARQRTAATSKGKKDYNPNVGGTSYEDFGDQGYGSKEDYIKWIDSGKMNMFTDPKFKENLTSNPAFQLATTVGRGSYQVDPNDPNIIHYTDSYDFVQHDKTREIYNGKSDNAYQPFRRGLSKIESDDAEKDPANRIHFAFNVKEMEDRLAKKKGSVGMRYGGLTRFQVAGQSNAPKVTAKANPFMPAFDPNEANQEYQLPDNQTFFTGVQPISHEAGIAANVKRTVAEQNPELKNVPVPGSGVANATKVANSVANFGDGMLSIFNTYSQLANLNNQQKQREANSQMLRSQNATWNQQYNPQLNRGDYSQGPSSYGLFKPNQMFAQQGIEVPLSMDEAAKYTVDSIDSLVGANTIGIGAPEIQQPQFAQQQMQEAPTQETTAAPMNEPVESTESLKDSIAYKESRGNYKAFNPKGGGSGAVGKYQFRWDHNKDWIANVTGIKNKQSFLNNPEAQEKAFDYWDQNVLTPNAQKIKSQYNPSLNMNEIKMLIHFQGPTGADRYFKTGKYTTDAEGTTPMRYLGKNIDTKQGVKATNLDSNLMAFVSNMGNRFPGLTMSSGNDSQHMKGSKHYKNKAIDIGANSSNRQSYNQLANFLAKNPTIKSQYGIEDIINEGDHLHVEMMQRGGEYELTADQIMQIKAMGGDVEFI